MAWCTCQGVQFFLPNLLSFLAFHIYYVVVRIFRNKEFETESDMKVESISCTPSSSSGKLFVRRVGSAKNHTAQAKSQWENRWASVSIMLQVLQCLSMWAKYHATLSPVARVLLISLQDKVLTSRGSPRVSTSSIEFVLPAVWCYVIPAVVVAPTCVNLSVCKYF